MKGYFDENDGCYVTGDKWYELDFDSNTLRVYWEGEMYYKCISDEMGGLIFITQWELDKPMIKRIEVVEGTTTIGMGAFFGCMLAESISIPESVKRIDAEAFSGCASLRSIDIPEGVEIMDDRFCCCLALGEINVSGSNPRYYSRDGVLFSRDGTLLRYPPNKAGETYRVPEDTRDIAKCAFLDAQHLKDVVLPEGFNGSRPILGMHRLEPQV